MFQFHPKVELKTLSFGLFLASRSREKEVRSQLLLSLNTFFSLSHLLTSSWLVFCSFQWGEGEREHVISVLTRLRDFVFFRPDRLFKF